MTGDSRFQYPRFIEAGMHNVHSRIVARNYLQDLTSGDFAQEAAEVLGDVNYVHPFREGNRRTQLQYLKQLGQQAGHAIDLTRLDQNQWIEASRDAHIGDYHPMADCIQNALNRVPDLSHDRRTRSRRR